MPRKSEWVHRIDNALEELRALPYPVIDRATLQKVLRVSPRHALRILRRLPAFSAGTSLLIGRQEVLAKLESIRQQPEVEVEVGRRVRLDQRLLKVRRELAGRRVSIVAPADVGNRRMDELPLCISLRPGELRVEFHGAEDLLRYLLELSQAIMNDFERFEGICQGSPVK